ncbi:TPA: hypothetical protein ACOEOK_000535 [Stenotrophomonas maltophilia]
MSRTPASFSLTVVRGATWEDDFTYTNPDGSPFDLTGYQARMQVRTLAGQFGLTEADTGNVTVRLAGTVEEGSWTWHDGAVWCGADGALTQSPGDTGWLLCVGRALNATTLMIDFDSPIARI